MKMKTNRRMRTRERVQANRQANNSNGNNDVQQQKKEKNKFSKQNSNNSMIDNKISVYLSADESITSIEWTHIQDRTGQDTGTLNWTACSEESSLKKNKPKNHLCFHYKHKCTRRERERERGKKSWNQSIESVMVADLHLSIGRNLKVDYYHHHTRNGNKE